MKKVLTIFLCFVMLVTTLSGCNLVVKDLEKDLAKVLAVVGDNYGDEDYYENVTKRDYLISFNQNGVQYLSSYPLDMIMDYIYNQLVSTKALVQISTKGLLVEYTSQSYPINNMKLLSDVLTKPTKSEPVDKVSEALKYLVADYSYLKENNAELEKYLNNAYNQAFNETVTFEQDTIKDLIETIKQEEDPDYESEEEVAEKEKRPTRTLSENEKVVINIETTMDELNEQRAASKSSYEGRAYSRYQNSIRDNKYFSDYEDKYIERYFELVLVEKLQQKVIEIYETLVGDQEIQRRIDDNTLEAQLLTRYNLIQNQQAQQFGIDETTYITQLEGLSADTFLLAGSEDIGGYGFVKHILIQFDAKQSFEFANVNNMAITEEERLIRRQALLDQILVSDLRDENEDEGFVPYDQKLNIYDFYNYFKSSFGYDTTSNPNVFRATQAPQFTTPIDTNQTSDVVGTNYINATSSFVDWIFTYNTDPGMFNNNVDYLLNIEVSPYLSNEKFMKEFAAAARETMEIGVGAYTITATDYGWHIVYCSDKIEIVGNISPNLAVLDKIKAGTTTFEDEQDPLYKIYKILRSEITSRTYDDFINKEYENYLNSENGKYINKNEKVFKDIYNQINAQLS